MVFRKLALSLARNGYVQRAIKEKADLRIFREKPSVRVYVGIVIIIISYILGWPAVAFFGFLAYLLNEPLIAIIGAPTIYIFSHILLWVGIFLAGVEYSRAFFRWLTRIFVERFVRKES